MSNLLWYKVKYKPDPFLYRWSDVHGPEVAQDYSGESHPEAEDRSGTDVQRPAAGDHRGEIPASLHLSHGGSSSLEISGWLPTHTHTTCVIAVIWPSILTSQTWHQSLLPLTRGLFLQAVCIENSCLIRGSKEGSNGALHLMRILLKPAENNMFEILTAKGGFKYVHSDVLNCSLVLQTVFFSISFHWTHMAQMEGNWESAVVAGCQPLGSWATVFFSVPQDLFVSHGKCRLDRPAETGGRLYSVRPERWGLR